MKVLAYAKSLAFTLSVIAIFAVGSVSVANAEPWKSETVTSWAEMQESYFKYFATIYH